MSRYAENTSVTSEASRSEIERTISRYGATSFAYGWENDRAVIGFRIDDRQVRFVLPMPNRNDREFTHTPTRGTPRTPTAAATEYDKAVRQRWRALALVVKAKLEAVEAGIVTFDEEFLAHIVLPGGQTVHDTVMPQVARALETGVAPGMLQIGAEP